MEHRRRARHRRRRPGVAARVPDASLAPPSRRRGARRPHRGRVRRPREEPRGRRRGGERVVGGGGRFLVDVRRAEGLQEGVQRRGLARGGAGVWKPRGRARRRAEATPHPRGKPPHRRRPRRARGHNRGALRISGLRRRADADADGGVRTRAPEAQARPRQAPSRVRAADVRHRRRGAELRGVARRLGPSHAEQKDGWRTSTDEVHDRGWRRHGRSVHGRDPGGGRAAAAAAAAAGRPVGGAVFAVGAETFPDAIKLSEHARDAYGSRSGPAGSTGEVLSGRVRGPPRVCGGFRPGGEARG